MFTFSLSPHGGRRTARTRCRSACADCGVHCPASGQCTAPAGAILRLQPRAVQRSSRGDAMSPHGIHLTDGHIPSRGSAFGGPALLGWSRPHERPTLLASDRPRTSIIMLLHGRHRRWVASVALHQNCEYRLRQAYWSRPVPPNHRNRRAFPRSGKAA